MKSPPLLNAQVRHEATEWLLAFSEEEVDAAGRERFNAWLRRSPEHVRAYLRIAALWESAGGMKDSSQRTVEDLIRHAQLETNVQALAVPDIAAPRRPRCSRLLLPLSMAATVLVVLGACAWFYLERPLNYSAAVGEQRTLTLPDGSTVALNARSRISVRYDAASRRIELLEGQALFKVAKDGTRPFVVRSDQTEVQALGTQFDVNRKRAGLQVTVLEGSVAVASQVLKRGEQVTVTPQAVVASVRPNLEAATAWTDGLLIFDGAPLSEVIEEYNRHNLKPLVVQAPDLQQLSISGIFPATGSARITRFLQERFDVAIEETDSGIFIRRS